MRYRLETALIALVPLLCVVCSAVADPQTGEVRIHVRGPDCKPAAFAAVELNGAEYHPHSDNGPHHAQATTDSQGIVQFPWPPGVDRINVVVEGVGYGMTGLVEILPGQSIDVSLPPLAPLACVEGSIPFDLADGDVKIHFDGNGGQPTVVANVEPDGRFSARLPPDHWWITALRGKERIAALDRDIWLSPGQTVRDVKLTRVKASPDPGNAATPQDAAANQKDQTLTAVQGTVRDESGQGVEGATVYFTMARDIRAQQVSYQTLNVVTDAAGHYSITGPQSLMGFGFPNLLIVYKAGFLPQQVWVPISEKLPVKVDDVVLAARGGKMDVTVVNAAGPVAGAAVGLHPENLILDNTGWASAVRSMSRELQDILYLGGTTGPDGIAHFDALPPGLYRVAAIKPKPGAAPPVHTGLRSKVTGDIGAIAAGVVVRASQTTSHRLFIYGQENAAAVMVMRHDGQPLHPESERLAAMPMAMGPPNLGYECELAGSPGNVLFDLQFNSGQTMATFNAPGLWRMGFRYHTASTEDGTRTWEPCFAARGFLAVSPWLSDMPPVKLTAMRFNPGSVEVQLQDVAGHPMRGIVELERAMPDMVASTDDAGRVRFDNVASGRYFVRSYLSGQGEGDLEHLLRFPDSGDAALTDKIFMPIQQIDAQSNTVGRVVLRAIPAAYVRGHLHVPTGSSAGDFGLDIPQADRRRAAHVCFDPQSGEFIAGPFPAGKATLRINRPVAGMYDGIDWGFQEVELTGGRVSRLEITPASVSPLVSRLDELRPQILLNDGKTPALGAVLYCFSEAPHPVWRGTTDAAGNVFGAQIRVYEEPSVDHAIPDNPAQPIFVALLPGSNGAAIVDAASGLKIVLPPPLSVRGKVTIANASPSGKPGQLRVLAACEGKGRLNTVLSVWATPQENGTFELAGLTPGTYKVQAALDGIWLSQSVPLTVSDHALEAIHLDIAAPAGPVCVQLVDPQGQPLRGAAIQVDRPPGPLASLDWPSEFKTDGAGEAYIPALEAGKHIIHVVGANVTREVTPPALPAEGPTVVRIQTPATKD